MPVLECFFDYASAGVSCRDTITFVRNAAQLSRSGCPCPSTPRAPSRNARSAAPGKQSGASPPLGFSRGPVRAPEAHRAGGRVAGTEASPERIDSAARFGRVTRRLRRRRQQDLERGHSPEWARSSTPGRIWGFRLLSPRAVYLEVHGRTKRLSVPKLCPSSWPRNSRVDRVTSNSRPIPFHPI